VGIFRSTPENIRRRRGSPVQFPTRCSNAAVSGHRPFSLSASVHCLPTVGCRCERGPRDLLTATRLSAEVLPCIDWLGRRDRAPAPCCETFDRLRGWSLSVRAVGTACAGFV
jgi:hypothetical protein